MGVPETAKNKHSPLLLFQGAFEPGTVDMEKRRVQCRWYTGARVARYSFSEGRYLLELSMEPKAVDLKRIQCGGAPLLNAHNSYSLSDVIGVVEEAKIDNGIGTATVRFSSREDVEPIFHDVCDGIIRNISMGAIIEALELLEAEDGQPKVYRATKWSVHELSLVPIGADMNAQTFSAETGAEEDPLEELIGGNSMEQNMTKSTGSSAAAPVTTEPQVINLTAEERAQLQQAERDRVTEILALCRKHGMKEDFAQQCVKEGTALDGVRVKILEQLAAAAPTTSSVSVGAEESDKQREALSLAILNRVAPETYKADDSISGFRGRSLCEMARVYLGRQGVKTDDMPQLEIAHLALANRTQMGAMMTTGDMPIVLGNTIARRLRDQYQEMTPTWPQFCRRNTAPNFKEMTIVSLAGDTKFKDVPESAEYTAGSLTEASEKYSVKKSGRIISLSFEMMINDDLGAFNRIPQMVAAAARMKEADTIYGILNNNGNMSDGKALFHADHGNLASSGADPSESTLSAACVAMYEQTDLAGDKINVKPNFIVFGPKMMVTVKKLLSLEMTATKSADVNVFKGAFVPVMDQHISDKRWFLISDPAMCDTIEYAYLDGMEGVSTETQYGFEVDGVTLKARMIFGAKAIDYRGMYKNAGAA